MSEKRTTETEQSWADALHCLGENGLLSVVMPCFRLEGNIQENLKEVHDLLTNKIPFEIVAVDDGSPDGTGVQIQQTANAVPHVKPVILPRNLGKGGALKAGIRESNGTHVLMLDADLDLPPAQLSTFFTIFRKEKADIVIGSKRHPDSTGNYPWHRRLASSMYYTMVKLIIGLPVRDTQTGMKLFRREAIEYAVTRMLVKAFAFDLEILAIANEKGFKIAEAPVVVDFQSKVGCLNWQTVKRIANDTLAIFYRLRWLKYYKSLKPLPMPDPDPKVSVIIACRALNPYVEESLRGLANQAYTNFEILLLPDETSGRAWPDNLREIPTGRLSLTEKRNIGIDDAEGDIVALLGEKSWPVAQWMERALPYFSDPAIAAVGGPASTATNDSFMARASGRVYANPLVSGNLRYRYEPERVREVDEFPSNNLFVRTDVLRKLNNLKTDICAGEDTILCMRITHDLGKKILYDPWVQVFSHRQPLFLPHVREIGRYALHRGYFAKRLPTTSCKLAYALPSLLLTGVLLGAAVAGLHPVLSLLYLAALWLYLLLTLLTSANRNPRLWATVWLGTMVTHAVYGLQFLRGLFSKSGPGLAGPLPRQLKQAQEEQ